MIALKIIFVILAFIFCGKVFSQQYRKDTSKVNLIKSLNINYPKSAQDEDTISSKSINKIITSYPAQLYSQFSSVFSIGKKELIWLTIAAGITGGLILSDAVIDKNVKDLKKNHSWIKTVSPEITEFGGTYGLLATASFAGFSLITKNDKGLKTSILALEAAFSSGIWTRIGKIITGRERPSASHNRPGNNSSKWSGPFTQFKKANRKNSSSFDAFPSGHTAEAFAIATVFAEQYKNNLIVPIISYSFASIVGITRMIEHTHWASDVFVGGIIGYLCGKSAVNFNNFSKKLSGNKKLDFSITPSLYGANLNLKF